MQIYAVSLKTLERRVAALLDGGTITQNSIAIRAKVDQGLVSRLKHGHLRRMTPRLLRIWKYVNTLADGRGASDDLGVAVDAYLAAGGDPQVLVRQIDLLRSMLDAHSRPPR